VLTFQHYIGPGIRIRFSGKPDARIRDLLKANGFRWSPGGGDWWRARVGGAADFLAALDRALNPGRPDAPCWKCGDPRGFFRNRGAATPVWCDQCHAAVVAAESQPDRFDLDYEDRCRDACSA
jgi:hypothetical protein